MRSGLSIIPYTATFHTVISYTWLDVYAVSKPDNILSSDQLPVPFLSGYDLIYVEFVYKMAVPERIFEYRDFSSLDCDAVCNKLISADWNDYAFSVDVDGMVYSLNKNMMDVVHNHAPLRRLSTRRPPAP